jgi:hypothetical protein
MKVISKLADYNNEMEKERSEKLKMKMACNEAEVIEAEVICKRSIINKCTNSQNWLYIFG